jgi:hypothetical protein
MEIVDKGIGTAPNGYETDDPVVFSDQNHIFVLDVHLVPMASEIGTNLNCQIGSRQNIGIGLPPALGLNSCYAGPI